MKKSPLVSVIVPTKNSAPFLTACLQSIKGQIYTSIELIVVDNFSSDETLAIAKKYTKKAFSKGPERSAQRNFAATKATGDYIVFIDSDMELGPKVVEQCVAVMTAQADVEGVVIHEESFGNNFWARCKALERSFYVDVPWIEAARFFRTKTYHKLGGYNETLVSGEDWDLSKRAAKLGKIVAIDEFIRHNEGDINLLKTLKKKYYYAQHAAAYLAANPEDSLVSAQAGPLNRYRLFFSQLDILFKNPFLGVSMLFMKTSEFVAGGLGYIIGRERS